MPKLNKKIAKSVDKAEEWRAAVGAHGARVPRRARRALGAAAVEISLLPIPPAVGARRRDAEARGADA